MNLDQATRRRTLTGVAAGILCVCALAVLVDGLLCRFREPANKLHLLAGDAVKVDGPLLADEKGVDNLLVDSDGQGVVLVFFAAQKGHWLGGNMWRGEVRVAPETPPGPYTLVVRHREPDAPQTPYAFRVIVHPDPRSLRLSSKSLVRRYSGWSPFLTAAAFLPLIALSGLEVYRLSRRREELLAATGQAEIYRFRQTEGVCEVAFGLGARHGLQAGSVLTLINDQGVDIGTVEVVEALPNDSVARVSSSAPFRPGFRVAKR